MLDNVDNIIDSTWRLCALVGGWVSGLISKPYTKVVGSAFDGSISRLANERENRYLDYMDQCIYISSSDDELEEIVDPRRIPPIWASERNSDSRRAKSSNASSSNVFNHSQVKPNNQPGPSNGSTSQHQTVNSRISNSNGAGYEKMSSQQAFNRTLPPSFQSSASRALPPLSFAPNNRLSNSSSSQLHDAYKSRHHGVGPSSSGEKGFFRGNDGDRFMNQNGGTRALPPSLMLGKAITPPFASSSEMYRSGAGDERAPETDERLIYEAALQVFHYVCHRIYRLNFLDSQSCMKEYSVC